MKMKHQVNKMVKVYSRIKCKKCEKIRKCKLVRLYYINTGHDNGNYKKDKLIEMWNCPDNHIFRKSVRKNGSDLSNHTVWETGKRNVMKYRVALTSKDLEDCKL